MSQLLAQTPGDILHAGLHPTFDQLEMYAYHLPSATLSNLLDIFISLSTLDDNMYSLCHLDDFKFLADMIEHIRLPLKAKYTFCCAPINRKMPFVCTSFMKMARQYSKGDLVSFDWLCSQVGWPFSPPETILDLVHLEAVHDVFDLYLWLSYRFEDMFPDVDIVRQVQVELDSVIEEGVSNIVMLLKNAETPVSSRTSMVDEDSTEVKKRQMNSLKNIWTHHDSSLARKEPEPPRRNKQIGAVRADVDFRTVSDRDDTLEVAEQSPQTIIEDSSSPPTGKRKTTGKLTSRLLQQGLVTPQMLDQLRREFRKEEDK